MFGNLLNSDFVAPSSNQCRKDDSNSGGENDNVRMQSYVSLGSMWFVKAEYAEAEDLQKIKKKRKHVVKTEVVTPPAPIPDPVIVQ